MIPFCSFQTFQRIMLLDHCRGINPLRMPGRMVSQRVIANKFVQTYNELSYELMKEYIHCLLILIFKFILFFSVYLGRVEQPLELLQVTNVGLEQKVSSTVRTNACSCSCC